MPIYRGTASLKIRRPAIVSSLTPVYVTGDRRGSITALASASLLGFGTAPALVDGSFATSAGPLGSAGFNNGTVVTTDKLTFDFGAGVTKLVTEAKWYQDVTTSHGLWQWYGSTDAVTQSAAIGSSFTLGGSTLQTQTQLNGNTTAYRAYLLVGVSGVRSAVPWLEEIEFKQA